MKVDPRGRRGRTRRRGVDNRGFEQELARANIVVTGQRGHESIGAGEGGLVDDQVGHHPVHALLILGKPLVEHTEIVGEGSLRGFVGGARRLLRRAG